MPPARFQLAVAALADERQGLDLKQLFALLDQLLARRLRLVLELVAQRDQALFGLGPHLVHLTFDLLDGAVALLLQFILDLFQAGFDRLLQDRKVLGADGRALVGNLGARGFELDRHANGRTLLLAQRRFHLLPLFDKGVEALADILVELLARALNAHLEFRQTAVAGGFHLGDLLIDLFALAALHALHLIIQAVQRLLARILIDLSDDVLREVQHAVQVAARNVEQQAEVRGHAARVPHVRYRRRQLDVAHPLAPHRGARHFHAALVADHTSMADVLVLAAVALPVARGAKDGFVEKSVLLGAQAAIVDRLRPQDLAI